MNYYELLQITPQASVEEIEQAYRRLARKIHPDLNPRDPQGAADRMKELNKIREILTDPDRRFQYDEELSRASFAHAADTFSAPSGSGLNNPIHTSGWVRRYPVFEKNNSRILISMMFAAAILLGISGGYWFHQNRHPVVEPAPALESVAPVGKKQERVSVKPVIKPSNDTSPAVNPTAKRQPGPEVIGPGTTRAVVLKVLGSPLSSKVDPYSNEETLDYGSLQLVLRDGRVRYGTTRK